MEEDGRIVCVTGGTGYIASWLVMRLLEHGYLVRATVRLDPDCNRDIRYLTDLPGAAERLQIFNADLNQPDSFEAAIQGCMGVFHVAHPMDVKGKEPEEIVTKRAVDGLLGILKASLSCKTVKRVVYTSTAGAILYNTKGLSVNDESIWSDLDLCRGNELISMSYLGSKIIAEKTALEFAERHGLEVVTLVLPLVVGPFICPNMPPSVYILLTMILGKQDDYKYLFGTYNMVHIDDVANAHIFLLEHPDANGRYICSSVYISVHAMFEYLSTKYPEFELLAIDRLKDFKGQMRSSLSSTKLLNSGFKFKYSIDQIFSGAIQSCKDRGIL
ncbi:protein BRI1-5 ENHANCED 1 [Herrania umbratica]|uniref:Protein BRI1-5 ENHANCED 1 n=1 Tax=Herrania umbratica TaxID=108875 RepID=A0A6J1A0F1_9ROSI|nr:protein BRI1-5 ENHANCED 1 [Herrania umbratica]